MRRACILLLALGGGALGEDVAMTVESAHFPIAAVGPGRGLVREVLIEYGRGQGVVAGWRGVAYAVGDERNGTLLGQAEVVAVTHTLSRVRVTLSDPALTIRAGDTVSIRVRVPKLERSILWSVVTFGTTLRGTKFVTNYRDLVHAETREMVEERLDDIVAMIRTTASTHGDLKQLTTPLAKGRYKGRKPGDLMANATRAEVLDFLHYLVTFNRDYFGRTRRADEWFAGWLLGGAPYSNKELLDKLVKAGTPAERGAIFAIEPDSRSELIRMLDGRAETLAGDGELDEARRMLAIVDELLPLVDDPKRRRWHLFSTAYVLGETDGQEQASLAKYQEMVDVCVAEKDPSGEAYALHNIGAGRESIGDHAGAVAAYTRAVKLKEEHDLGAATTGLSHRARGDALRKLGRHQEAIAAYEKAEALYRQLDSLEGLTDVFTGRAKALAKLGRNKEAAAVHAELRKEHVRVGDRAREADTLENIGSQNWDLGDYATAFSAYRDSLRIRRELGRRPAIGFALMNLGRLQDNLGAYGKARGYHEEALALWRAEKNRKEEAESLTDLARMDAKTGDFDGALRRLEEALSIQRAIGNRTGEAYAQQQVARLRADRHEYELALQAHDEAVRLSTGGALADALRNRAWVHLRLKNNPQAHADYAAALKISRDNGEKGEEAQTLLGMGRLLSVQFEVEAALARGQEALDLARAIGNRLTEARCLRFLGRVHWQRYDLDTSNGFFARALALFEHPSLNDPAEIAETRNYMTQQLANRGRFRESLAAFRDIFEQARQAGATLVAHSALLRAGEVLHTLGDLDGALRELERAAALVKDNDWSRAETLYAMASVHLSRGDGGKALALAREVLAIYDKLRNDWGRASALNEIAFILSWQGDAERALATIKRSLAASEHVLDKDMALAIRGTMGEILLDLGDPAGALERFEESLRLAREIGSRPRIAEMMLYIGSARRAMGPSSFEAADRALREGLAYFEGTGQRGFISRFRVELAGLALDRGSFDEALARAGEILPTPQLSPHVRWKAHQVRSRAAEALGDLDAAVEHRRAAIAVVDRLRAAIGTDARAQREFLRSKIKVYESMAELLGKLIDRERDQAKRRALIREALDFIARARFEILNDGLRGLSRGGANPVDALLEKIDQAKRDIARLEKRLEDARTAGNTRLEEELTKVLATNLERLSELHDNLKAADPDFDARVKFNPAYMDEVETLPPDARLVIYFPGEKNLFLWVYSADGIVAWKQHAIPRAELYGKVGRFRDRIDEVILHVKDSKGRGFGEAAEKDERNPPWYRQNSRAMRLLLTDLHKDLIDPVAEEIAAADPLLIVPYGQLNYLPFEALLDTDGRFLGEKKRMAYYVHMDHLKKSLARLRAPAARGEDVWVAYADPVNKLKDAIEEANEIKAMFGRSGVHTKSTGTATEAQLRAIREDCTILHFATHGFLNGLKPADTYLELAPDDAYDGKLMQKEVFPGLKSVLKARRGLRLVVLSACETARAQNAPEAEVLGMPDKFAAAGSPAVVASLWSVYTWSTTDLMVEFYRRMVPQKMDTAAALLGARQALVKDRARGRYAHPYYWAPFLLFGDWR